MPLRLLTDIGGLPALEAGWIAFVDLSEAFSASVPFLLLALCTVLLPEIGGKFIVPSVPLY